jgi:NADH-quinone oxidoreductase subunit L
MSQTLNAHTLLAVPMAPLIGSLLAGVLGTALGGNRIGRKLSHTLTIVGVLVSFILSAITLKAVAVDGAYFNETLYTERFQVSE